jgi:hypothetical protein
MISKDQHVAFYDTEIHTQLEEWRTYVRKRMDLLIKDKKLFIGRLWNHIEESGTVLIRFKRKESPRLHWPYFFAIAGEDAKGNPNDWHFTFQEFIYSSDKTYYTKQGSDGEAIRYSNSDAEYAYFEVIFEDSSFVEVLKSNYWDNGIKPLLVVAKTYPPIAYLQNLKEFVENSNNDLLKVTEETNAWNPIDVDNESVDSKYFIDILNSSDPIIIQGPPGTGKSYTAAAICDYYIKQKKSVAVCALTNKALMEIAGQPGLKSALKSGLVYKTKISKDEQKTKPSLRNIEGFLPIQGNLLLTTYYKLSEFHKVLVKDSKRFDLLIIEEASQAFFASIVMFKDLAKQVLIIGDQQQLAPITITNLEKLLRINPNIYKVKLGLETFAGKLNSSNTYRLTKTRRLTSNCASLTGLFYDNKLISSSPLNGMIVHPPPIQDIFHPNGAVSIASVEIVGDNSLKEWQILERINKVLKEICLHSAEVSVAILVPTIYLEQLITQSVSDSGLLNPRLTISTIHRIQGITTDYTIYYMPLTNTHFELDSNLFNVATSRAKRGTLIITKSTILMNQMDKNVHQFLSKCFDVTTTFKNINV